MSRHLWAFAALFVFIAPAVAQGPTQQVLYPGLTGTTLRDAVRADFAPTQTLGYNAARDVLFAWEQSQYGRLRCVYTGMEIVLASGADPSSDAFSKGINTEHTVPRSQGSTGMAESDMHHLFPTRVESNSARGNYPFGEIVDNQTEDWFRGTVSQSSIPSSNIDEWSESTSSRFEPREDHEGNAARAVFYHAAVYTTMPTSFFQAQLDDLLRWNKLDPTDQAELDRSNWVATQQGTRNPFTVDSTLARRIWGDPIGCDEDCGEPPPPPTPSQGDIWVNEIHYDNGGTDQNEGVEIAGTAGHDLAGHTLQLYTGSNGTVYNTISLSGLLPDQQAGFGTAWFAALGLQNGSPDGLALVDASGAVLQFLSWEGTFTANGGAADGMTSVDIGFTEDSSTGANESLQLTGTGSAASDFSWSGPLANTRAQPNAGQTFEAVDPEPPTPEATAWINEVHYDNAGRDEGEGIEIAGTAGVDLTGWTLAGYDRGAFDRTYSLAGTIGDEGDGFAALWFAIPSLRNYTYSFALVDASGEVVDFVSWEGAPVATGGPADGLAPTDMGVNEGGRTQVGQSLQLEGTGASGADFMWAADITASPGFLNDNQTIGSVPEPPASVELWINEIHYDNGGRDENEGVEVAGTAGANLNGYTVLGYDAGVVSRTITLSGLVPDEGAGIGAVWAEARSLRNYTYALALVSPEGDVLDFVSYEGSMTATDGPAAGMTSVDLGVSEGGSTTGTESLQRTGAGSSGVDFVWSGPAAQSQGFLNVGQTIGGALTAQAPEAPSRIELASGVSVAPNPVRTRARIAIPFSDEDVRVELYDALGRRVALLHDGAAQEAIEMDATAMAPGVYIVRVTAGVTVQTVRLTVAR